MEMKETEREREGERGKKVGKSCEVKIKNGSMKMNGNEKRN